MGDLIREISTGKSVNSDEGIVGADNIGVLKTSCVSYDHFDPSESKPVVKDERHLVKCAVEGDSVIVSRMNTPERVGACGYVERSFPNLFLPDRLWKLKFQENVNTYFLYTMLVSGGYKEKITSMASGTSGSMYNIPKDAFLNLRLALSLDIDEQKKIGDYFKQLDHLITLHQCKCHVLPKQLHNDWEQRKFGSLLDETRNKTSVEDEDTLLSCAINGMYLNSELFSHFRGASNIGYLKVKKNDLILSAQNLHLGNSNVNLRFEHGIISPAYKVYELVDCNPLFMQAWVKRDSTKDFFLRASTEGASVCRKNIVWEELYKQELLVPNIEEQKKIGAYFDNTDRLITLHHRKYTSTLKSP